MKHKIELKDLKGKIPNHLFKSWFEYDDIDSLKTLNQIGILVFGQCREEEPVMDKTCFIYLNKIKINKLIDEIISNKFVFTNQNPKTIYVILKWTSNKTTHIEVNKTNICKILFNTIPFINHSGNFGDMNHFDDESCNTMVYLEFYNLFKKMCPKHISSLLDYISIFEGSYDNKKHIDISRTWLLQQLSKKKYCRFCLLQCITIGLSLVGIALSIYFGLK